MEIPAESAFRLLQKYHADVTAAQEELDGLGLGDDRSQVPAILGARAAATVTLRQHASKLQIAEEAALTDSNWDALREEAEQQAKHYETYTEEHQRVTAEISPATGDGAAPTDPRDIQEYVNGIEAMSLPDLSVEQKARWLAVLDIFSPVVEEPMFSGMAYPLADTENPHHSVWVGVQNGNRMPNLTLGHSSSGDAITQAQSDGHNHLLVMRASLRTLAELRAPTKPQQPRYQSLRYVPLGPDTAATVDAMLPTMNQTTEHLGLDGVKENPDSRFFLTTDFEVVPQHPWEELASTASGVAV